MGTLISVVRAVLAVVVGYAVMVALITLVQEVWLGGVGYYESGWGELMVAGFFTFLCAVTGGATAALIAKSKPMNHAIVMGLLVVVETFALIITGKSSGPIWFDAVAAASLIAGVIIGAALVKGGVSQFKKSGVEPDRSIVN